MEEYQSMVTDKVAKAEWKYLDVNWTLATDEKYDGNSTGNMWNWKGLHHWRQGI